MFWNKAWYKPLPPDRTAFHPTGLNVARWNGPYQARNGVGVLFRFGYFSGPHEVALCLSSPFHLFYVQHFASMVFLFDFGGPHKIAPCCSILFVFFVHNTMVPLCCSAMDFSMCIFSPAAFLHHFWWFIFVCSTF